MQLRSARLCLDCEELHEQQQCPICASETFVYLTRWIPVEDRRARLRPTRSATPTDKSPASRWAQRGAIGLAAIAAGRWLWQTSQRAGVQESALPRQGDGRQSDDDSEGADKGPAGTDA